MNRIYRGCCSFWNTNLCTHCFLCLWYFLPPSFPSLTSLVAQMVKNLPAMQETRVRKIPWRRKWQSTPVFLPGESHGEFFCLSMEKLPVLCPRNPGTLGCSKLPDVTCSLSWTHQNHSWKTSLVVQRLRLNVSNTGGNEYSPWSGN